MAFCTTGIRRGAAAALLAVLAACDSNTPDTFNPEATSADVGAMQSAFSSPAVTSFSFAANAASSITGGGPAATVAQLDLASGKSSDRSNYVTQVSRLVHRAPAGGLSTSSAGIPPEALGKTFVWDTATDEYIASDRTGAPSDGVRLILYAVNPITGQYAEPLNEIGHADVVVEEGETSASAQVLVVSGGTTYLDYEVDADATGNGGRVLVDGFVTDGTTRADFRLDNNIVLSGESLQFTLDYGIDVPTRDLEFDFDMTLAGDAFTDDGSVTLSLTLSGPNGRVDMAGNYATAGAAGTLDVDVNGDDFATISVTASSSTEADIVVTGANGGALTAAEREALEDIFNAFEDGFDVFEDLLQPLQD